MPYIQRVTAQHSKRRAIADAPEPDCLVLAAADDELRVRAERNGPHRTAMSLERAQKRAIRNAPDPHAAVVAAGEEQTPVIAEIERGDARWMTQNAN